MKVSYKKLWVLCAEKEMSKAELRKRKRIQNRRKGAVQSQHFHADVLQEYLPADKTKQYREDLSNQIDCAVAHDFLCTVHTSFPPDPNISSAVFQPCFLLRNDRRIARILFGMNLHSIRCMNSAWRMLFR